MRLAAEDVEIPDTNFIIPKGWKVSIATDMPFNNDEGSFPGTKCFYPERFMGDGVSSQHCNYMGANYGFSKGVHTCPGNKFAVTEAKLFIALLMLTYPNPRYFPSACEGGGDAQHPALEFKSGLHVHFGHA